MDYRKSSLGIGRRTRTNVLKDKDIRKDKDGCDVFEDYWTDSEDDQSSCHSESSYAKISAKSLKGINQSDSGNGDSGSKSREVKTPTCRLAESELDNPGSTVDEVPAEISIIKSQRRSQVQKNVNVDLSMSKPSLIKNYTLNRDELNTENVTRTHRETYFNDIENQANKTSNDETAALDYRPFPRNSTLISKQSEVANFNGASAIEDFGDGAVPSTSETVNISKRIVESPKQISEKHIFDLMNNRNLKGTEFELLKSVSPLSKNINRTMTLLSKRNLKSVFHNPCQHLDDPPGNFTKLNKGSKTKLSATSPNSTLNTHKSIEKHKVKTRSAMEMEKILSNYDEYDARIMQIIRENNEDNKESSEKNALEMQTPETENVSLNVAMSSVLKEATDKHIGSNETNQATILKNHMLSDSFNKIPLNTTQGKNNTFVLSKLNNKLSTSKSFEISGEESSSENVSFKDSYINVSDKVLANPVLLSKPESCHKRKEIGKYKSSMENKQSDENSDDDVVKKSSSKQKKLKLLHTKHKIAKNASPVKEVLDNDHHTNYLSSRKNKLLKSLERSKQIEESGSKNSAVQNTSMSRVINAEQRVVKYVLEKGVAAAEPINNDADKNNKKDKNAEVDETCESYTNYQPEHIALKDSESSVSPHKPVNLSFANKNKYFKSSDRSKQTYEKSSSEDNPSENVLISRNRKMQKVSKSKNISQKVHTTTNVNKTKSIKDRHSIVNEEENFGTHASDQSDHLAMVHSELGVSPQKPVSLSYLKENKSLNSLERSKQAFEESSCSDNNTSANISMTRNRKMQKVSKNKNIPQKMPENATLNKTKSAEDRSAIKEVQGNCDLNSNNQSEHLAVIDSAPDVSEEHVALSYRKKNKLANDQSDRLAMVYSESGVSPQKPISLSYLKKNKSLKSSERLKQAYEENSCSEDDASVNIPKTRSRKMQNVSKNKNIPQKHENATFNKTKSEKDRSAIKEVQGNYDLDAGDQSEHLTVIDSAHGVSQKHVNISYQDKNKSLKSMERSKAFEESSEDSNAENRPITRSSNKRLKVSRNSSHRMSFKNTMINNKANVNVDTDADKEVSETETDIGHQSKNPISIDICPEQDVSFHKAVDALSSKKKRVKSKKNLHLAMSKNVATESSSEKQMRKSNRQRYAPLAHWRNERLLYRFENGLVKILGVAEGTREDDLPIQNIIKKQLNKQKIKGKSRKIKKASIYDSVNNKKVKMNLVKTYPSVPWDFPANVAGISHYRIKRVLESTNCAFGFVEINIRSSKPSQYMPEEDLQMTLIKGEVEVVIQENNFRVYEHDMFVVPRNTAYTLKNIGHTKALLSYAVGRFKFLENQSFK